MKYKPCPFCGNTEKLTLKEGELTGYAHWVDCENCNTAGPARDSEESAVEAWNKRATQS